MSATTKTVVTYVVTNYVTGAVLGTTTTRAAAVRLGALSTARPGAYKIARRVEVVEVPVVRKGLDLRRREDMTEDGFISIERMRNVKAYVARISLAPKGYQYGAFVREWVRGDERDLSRAGWGDIHFRTEHLADGLYEAKSTWRSLTEHVVIFEVRDGSVVRTIASQSEAIHLLREAARVAA